MITIKTITDPNDLISSKLIIDHQNSDGSYSCSGGLTKREYFAALAMQGLCVNMGRNGFTENNLHETALKIGDLLIEELNKEKEG
jgi:hypothetical protein